jgi:hypothetical protein
VRATLVALVQREGSTSDDRCDGHRDRKRMSAYRHEHQSRAHRRHDAIDHCDGSGGRKGQLPCARSLLRDKDSISSPGELRPYVSRLPTGLHLLAAPPDPAVMAQMTPELYGELLAFLRRFYEVILLDLGSGITAPIATFAVDHADQVVVVTTPESITNTKVQMALGHLRRERAALVLNKVDGSAEQRATERQFSRDRIAQRVAIPADGQLKTMLDSGTFALIGLGRSTRVPIKRLGLAVGTQLA